MINQNNKYCGQCGRPNPLTHKFCSSCGVKFEGTVSHVNKEENNQNSNSNRKAAIVGGITGAAAGYMGSRLAQTVDKLASESDISDSQNSNNTIPPVFASNNPEDMPEAIAIDVDENGVVDAIILDNDGDSIMDDIVMDVNSDGVIDAIALDKDNDGIFDEIIVDSDFDGKPDTSYTIEENELGKDADWEDFF